MLSADTIQPFLFTPKTRVCLRRCATEITVNQNVLSFPGRGASATLFKISRGLFSVRIALEMEAHIQQSRGASAGFERLNPSYGKSEEEMQIEERCKTRIPGRPGEGAVRGFSGAAQRSFQLNSQCANVPLTGMQMQSNKWRFYIQRRHLNVNQIGLQQPTLGKCRLRAKPGYATRQKCKISQPVFTKLHIKRFIWSQEECPPKQPSSEDDSLSIG